MVKISVIVPVYNASSTLNRCVDSILNQTFSDFELLLINDGSKDHSGQLCDEYAKKDPRVRVFHKENGGVSSARNLGLDNATGEWISFCDSDDWVLPEWLAIFIKHTDSSDLIISNFDIIHNNSIETPSPLTKESPKKLEVINYLETNNVFGYLWCKCFKQTIINSKNIRFNTTATLWEDVDFIYKYLAYINNIKYDVTSTYLYVYPEKQKYSETDYFDISYSIIRTIHHLVKDSKIRDFLFDRYGYALTYNLIKQYNNKKYNIGFQYLQKLKQMEMSIDNKLFNHRFKAHYCYFANYINYTNYLLQLFYGVLNLFKISRNRNGYK